jgi:thymidylate synthase
MKKVKYFATEEECSVYERTACTGEIFETLQDAINKDNEINEELLEESDKAMWEWIAETEDERRKEEEELRETYGVNWGNEPWEQPDEENLWDPNEGSPN